MQKFKWTWFSNITWISSKASSVFEECIEKCSSRTYSLFLAASPFNPSVISIIYPPYPPGTLQIPAVGLGDECSYFMNRIIWTLIIQISKFTLPS